MGCSSGKVSAPKSASKTARAENTLLGSSGQYAAVKEAAGVPVEAAELSKTVFDGVWTKGVIAGYTSHRRIAGDSLTWANGTISRIRVDEMRKVLEVDFKGSLFTGSLSVDGDKIHWSNGDNWDRCEVDADEIPKLSDDDLLTKMEGHLAHVDNTAQPTKAGMAPGNAQASVEIQLADGPESIDQVAHTQAHKYGEAVPFAEARLPSMPEAAKPSPEKTRDQFDAESKQVGGIPKAPLAHTSDSQPPARITAPGSADNERMFGDSRKASPIQNQSRKEKDGWCC